MKILAELDLYERIDDLLRSESISWPRFANEIQSFFLKATHQNLVNPLRPLHANDLQYIHRRIFNSAARITVNQFTSFWDSWFSMVVRELRYKKHLLSMWYMGLILGFVEKDMVMAFLRSQESGHFVLRFSETKAGSIAVNALAGTGGKVSNYLIKSEETSSGKSHADLLRTKRELTHVLQFVNDYSPEGVPILRPLEKEVVLDPFCIRESESSPYGYDEWDEDGKQANRGHFEFNLGMEF